MLESTTPIGDLIAPDRVALDSDVASKKRALERISALLAAGSAQLSAVEVFDGLVSRERLGSTGLGHGVGLPHTRSARIQHPVGAFLRLGKGVDFDSLDRAPVDLMFGLLVPENAPEPHLQILARLAEMFRDPTFCQALRGSESPELLYAVLSDWTPATETP
jgi:PTS system nitrogen regulatory IIA component